VSDYRTNISAYNNIHKITLSSNSFFFSRPKLQIYLGAFSPSPFFLPSFFFFIPFLFSLHFFSSNSGRVWGCKLPGQDLGQRPGRKRILKCIQSLENAYGGYECRYIFVERNPKIKANAVLLLNTYAQILH